MGRGLWRVCRALVVVGALLPLVLGSSLEDSEEAEESFVRDEARSLAGGVAAEEAEFPAGQQSTSAPEGTAAHMERIVSPTLGPFSPSPEIKFPEPHSMRPPVYGEAKVPPSTAFDGANSGLTDVLTPPHNYHHPKPAPGYEYEPPAVFNDHIPPPSRVHHHQFQLQLQSHHPRPLHPLLFGGAKGEQEDFYLSYDGPEEDEQHAYQYLPPPGAHHFPPPKARPAPSPPATNSQHEGDADLLSKKAGKAKAWKTLVAALTTLVPIGLFLAALPPNYVTVTNSSSLRAGKAEYEGEEEYPMLGLMGRYGISALGDPDCESRVFCEMSRMGKDDGGNVVQRVLWRVVNDAPDMLTEMIGLRTLFKAARTDSCQTFKCKDTRGVDD